MPDLNVTIHTAEGDITVPQAQMTSLNECLQWFLNEGKTPIWHKLACGCCLGVHERRAHVTGGFVIGEDGGYHWDGELP